MAGLKNDALDRIVNTSQFVNEDLLQRQGKQVEKDRPEGSESKLNTFSDGFRVLRTIASLFREYKPFKFFLFVAALLWLIAIAFFIPVFIDYLQTGLVLKFPTVIVCGVVATMGALMWICGIILEVIVKKHRQLYELMLNQMNITLSQKKDDAKTDD